MAVIKTHLLCELNEAVKVQYLDGVLFSQDNQANQIIVTVLDNGQPATLSGTVSANVIRSDGGTVAATGGSISGNVVSITLPATAYSVPGVISVAVKITASGVVTTIAAFVATMYRSSTDTAVDPGTIMPSIQDLISQINTAVASIPLDYSSLWATVLQYGEEISNISGNTLPVILSLGSLNTNNGAEVESTNGTRARTTQIPINASGSYTINIYNPDRKATDLKILYYGSSYLSSETLNLVAGDNVKTPTIPSGSTYMRFRLDGTGIVASNIVITIKKSDSTIDNAVVNYGSIETSGLNLNDFIHPGMWSLSNTTYKPTNWPSDNSGRLVVFTSSSNTSFGTIQIVMDYAEKMYFRYSKTNGTWSDWSIVATQKQFENTVFNFGSIETAGLNLNSGDFVHPGMWSLSDMTYKPTNWPSDNSGRLVVFASSSDTSFATIQIIMDYSNKMYFRYSRTNGTWSDWKTVATQDQFDNTVYSYENITTANLDLNGGNFIKPGMWSVNNTDYLPKNCPTNKRCRIISFASSSSNTIYTYQIVIDADGNYFSRISTNTGTWTAWKKWNCYNANAFETLFTNPQPFVNNYDISRYGASVTNRVSKLYADIDGAVLAEGVTVTKDTLGKDASNTFDIYNYKVSLNTGSKPVVLIICGEHGDELTSAYIGYYLYKEIVNGALTKYLTYVDFWYVPLMNPYGYENATRNNANDVNLNRDFPCEWVYSTSSHNKTGNYSLSQVESQYIYNLMVNNKDKILFICNKHDTGGIAKKVATNQDDIVAYISTVLQTDKTINNGIAKWQNKQVRETDSWIIDDFDTEAAGKDISTMELISSLSYVTEGSLDLFANSIGIHGSLLEVAGSSYYTADGYYYYPIDQYHFKDLARLGLDFFVNYIATSIEKNAAMLRDNTIIPSNLRYYTRTESGGTWSVVEQYWNGSQLVNI